MDEVQHIEARRRLRDWRDHYRIEAAERSHALCRDLCLAVTAPPAKDRSIPGNAGDGARRRLSALMDGRLMRVRDAFATEALASLDKVTRGFYVPVPKLPPLPTIATTRPPLYARLSAGFRGVLRTTRGKGYGPTAEQMLAITAIEAAILGPYAAGASRQPLLGALEHWIDTGASTAIEGLKVAA